MNTFRAHVQSSHVTFSEHVRKFELRLGESIAHRERIYLDTNFWILLREANRKGNSSRATTLLALLRRAVSDGKVVCPISCSIFVELMRQSWLSSRIDTARIIDELSLGITVVGFEERVAAEIEHLICFAANLNHGFTIGHAVWRKLSYILGITNFQNVAMEPKTDLAIQKAFFDHMCSYSLEEVVMTIGEEWVADEDHASSASSIDKQIAAHADELRSFEQAYDAEVRGVVNEVGDITLDIVRAIARDQQKRFAGMDYEQETEAKNRWKNLLCVVLEKDKARHLLPTLHIRASLYAALRWDKKRNFRSNDLWDFSHAEAGLGYCSAFFTDKSLHSIITQRHLGLDRVYGCRVGSSVEEAIEYVSGTLQMH